MTPIRPLLPRFDSALELEFQHDYYKRILPTLRTLSLLLGLMFAVYAIRDFSDTRTFSLAFQQDGLPASFFFLAFALTWIPSTKRFWQPLLVGVGLVVVVLSLQKMASFIASMHMNPAVAATAFPADSLFFGQQMRVLMVCMALLRFQFRAALVLQLGVLIIGTVVFTRTLLSTAPTNNDISRFLQPTLAIMLAVLLAAFVEEQLARRAFWANHQLEEERNDERRKREQTESKLHILAQAIGGIVHDLGSPLTTVQLGAETLDMFLDEDVDKATLHEYTGHIVSGVQLLNFLRLSLIEQTRVLEGRPTPVNIKPVALCGIIESGRRFQKPYIGTRAVRIESRDVQIFADEMKMVTVFMNLIGNALKYSDSDVSVSWRNFQTPENNAMLLIAVLDKGTLGEGITREQAHRLFTAFGRLDTHSQIEGTGLGLLSVQKIAGAHGGEAFIEGYEDGTPNSNLFSTATGDYPTMIEGEFRTAFVVTCRLAAPSKTEVTPTSR